MLEAELAGADEMSKHEAHPNRWIYDMDAHIIDTDEAIRPFLDERYRTLQRQLARSR